MFKVYWSFDIDLLVPTLSVDWSLSCDKSGDQPNVDVWLFSPLCYHDNNKVKLSNCWYDDWSMKQNQTSFIDCTDYNYENMHNIAMKNVYKCQCMCVHASVHPSGKLVNSPLIELLDEMHIKTVHLTLGLVYYSVNTFDFAYTSLVEVKHSSWQEHIFHKTACGPKVNNLFEYHANLGSKCTWNCCHEGIW